MAVKIPIAKFIENGVEKEVNARDIITRELYRNKYRGKLYCKENKCKARLHHVDLREYRGNMFFRTNGGDNPHKDRCPSEVLYKGLTTYTTSNGEAVEVSDEHIEGTIDRRIKTHKEKKSGTNITTPGEGSTSNTKTNIPAKPVGEKGSVTPSLNGQGKAGSGNEKGTRILGKEANQIVEKDFGKPRCVDGYIKEIYIYDNYAQIQFRDSSEYDVFIELGQAFKENNISAFNSLELIKKYVQYVINKEDEVYCVCVGLVQKRTDKIVVEVYKEIEFKIEESTIIQFVINNKELLSKI